MRIVYLLPLVTAFFPYASAQEASAPCKAIYRSVQQHEGEINDLNLALERENYQILADGSRSIIGQLDSTYQALRQGTVPPYLQNVPDRRKFAQGSGVEWNPRWANDREAFLLAMIQHEQQQLKTYQAQADGFTKQMRHDPGKVDLSVLESRLSAAKAAKAEADKNFAAQRCDPQAVAAAVASEAAQNSAKDAFLIQLSSLEEKVKAVPYAGERIRGELADASEQAIVATMAAASAGQHLLTLQSTQRQTDLTGKRCAGSAEQRREMEGYAQSAATKEQSVAAMIKQASEMKCSEMDAAAKIRKNYNTALQLTKEIAVLQRQAVVASKLIDAAQLTAAQLTFESSKSASLLKSAEEYAAAIDYDVERAKTAVDNVGRRLNDAKSSVSDVQHRLGALGIDYAKLTPSYQALYPAGAENPVYDRMLDLKTRLKSANGEVVPTAEFEAQREIAQGRLDVALQSAVDAKKALAAIRAGLKACEAKPATDLLDQIASLMNSAEIEVGMNTDLLQKAQMCGQSGVCQTLVPEIWPLLEKGAIETAQNLLSQAHAQGCNVGDLDQQLDEYRYVRDAAVAIMSLSDQCRFQDADTFAGKIPASYQNLSLIQDALARNRIGAKAQATARDLMDRANAASQRGDRAGAASLLRDAQREASLDGRWYACVSPMLNLSSALPGSGAPTAVPSSGAPATGSSPPSGPLVAKVEVKPSRQEGPGGRDKYSYSATSANIDSVSSEGQVHVSVTYDGVPQSLTPGSDIIITVSGSLSAQPQAYGANWLVTAWVEAVGLEAGSGQSASFSTKGVRTGKYVFRVPLNATSATITLKGDFGIGEPAVYRYQRKQ